MKIGNNGNLVLGPFDESTPCLMIDLMNCQTKLRINHLTAVKSVAILEKRARSLLYESKLPLKFWTEAINCSTQVSNVTPRKGKEKIPLEIWTDHVITSDRQNPNIDLDDEDEDWITVKPTVLELNDVQNQIPVRRSERLKSKLMSVHLVNNVPNSYFEAENSANWKLAMENELDSLDKHKETVYVLPSPGYEKLNGNDKVCKLKKDIYGLPQSDINCCQVIYSQFGLAIHQNDHQARRRFVEWAQNEIAVVPDFHKRILFSDEAHFWLNGYVNKQNCRIWSEANPQVYVETPLDPEKLTVWCALWAGGILLQKR
ncbi:retrovirus-related Pol polyprotein from transposon TNT 1-94 [Trichonephila clavipes]|nr:retrovirus-related Pol polyprotein from transposon TNT 1-94 [Trichonephila clavipes]